MPVSAHNSNFERDTLSVTRIVFLPVSKSFMPIKTYHENVRTTRKYRNIQLSLL